MTKPTKAQERLVARVRSKGPLVQDNTEDGARFFLAQGGACIRSRRDGASRRG